MAAVVAGPEPRPEADLSSFDSIPLFMHSLPNEEENVAIAALQSLAYEGTPDENADNFKSQGNEYFQGKRYREAANFYTQGIDAKPTDNRLMEALLCNRAACNLELKNFGSVLKDCSKALVLNQKSSKAYYRSAMALLALDRPDEALDCCDRCLSYDQDNAPIRQLRERAGNVKMEKERKEKDRQERIRAGQEAKMKLHKAFEERNLIPIQRQDEVSQNPYEPQFDPEDPTGLSLIIPVFFLYPQYATSDVISHFVEDTPFAAHLETMFPPSAPPPEWDTKREYVTGNLNVYAMTKRKRLLKVGKKMTLRDVCKSAKAKEGEPRDGLELKDGCLTFVVLPKGDVETNWIEEFKKTR